MSIPKSYVVENTRTPTGPTYRSIIENDKVPPAPDMLESHRQDFGTASLDKARYTSLDFHRQERKQMWSRVWQFACREEELSEVGDVIVYDLCNISLLIVRCEPDKIKAYYNSCLHRGTKLCASDTSVSQLRCPFHGFTWSLNGQLTAVPCLWDFPQISEQDCRLPEVMVARWGGFVFINLDPDASPLEQYLEVLPAHFTGHDDYTRKYIVGHYQKVIGCNWKAALEAFLESYHIPETHPQMVNYTSYDGTQYDVFPGARHTNRFLSTIAVPNTQIAGSLSEQKILDALFAQMSGGSGTAPTLPDGVTARQFMADLSRRSAGAQNNVDYSTHPDTQALDGVQYFLFPNMVLFRGFAFPMIYRARPNGDDPDSCIFDLFVMRDVPARQSRPEPASMVRMGDRSFSDMAPAFPSWLGKIYDQDTQTLKYQQEGLKAGGGSGIMLSRYQESRIRHLHRTLDMYLAGEI